MYPLYMCVPLSPQALRLLPGWRPMPFDERLAETIDAWLEEKRAEHEAQERAADGPVGADVYVAANEAAQGGAGAVAAAEGPVFKRQRRPDEQ